MKSDNKTCRSWDSHRGHTDLETNALPLEPVCLHQIWIGFSDSMNISYCALCVSDLLCILSLPWNAICYIPAFIDSGLQFLAREVAVPTGGALSQIFAGTTAWITAFISLERCLCVMFPLKSKEFVRSQMTVIIILLIFILGITPLTGITFFTYVFEVRFDEGKNRTIVDVTYRNSSFVDQLMDFNSLYTMIFTNTIPLVLIVLVVKLIKSAAWRIGHSSEQAKNSSGRKSTTEIRIAKTVLVIATAFILPGSLSSMQYLLSVTMGVYSRYYRSMARLGFLLSIYFRMWSKLRHTVNKMARITISVFGIIGNTQIILTFVNIGFSESINISYCALCVSDLLCILSLPWNAICYVPAFIDSGLQFLAREVVVPTGGVLSQIFAGTTAWITVFISLERCLCIMFPLKSKEFVRSQMTVIIILLIFILGITPLTGITFFTYVFEVRFDEGKNRTIVDVTYRNSSFVDQLMDFNSLYTMIFTNTIPLVLIVFCSIAVVVKLIKSAAWRIGHSSEQAKNSSGRKSTTEIRIAKTVLVIATAFILPGSLSSMHMQYLLSVAMGVYSRYYRSMARLGFLLSIYFRMWSKLRHTVNKMVCEKGRLKK
ncbi:hypothetical protein EGW08_008057 [Elysia chlorotica]|uniref:G-protein coupled receptors family 1 profile domain-containing protein n=1 Tax=Elysia chlorotica TaxID=188477 RepID=A0A3S1BHP9_ELYCH|nr:hypothetical protein EGW08_008057 [Elysia chlorotica]